VSKVTVRAIDAYLWSLDSDRQHLDYSDAQLLHRLSSSAYGVPKYRISKSLPGTSEWLLSHPLFLRWKSHEKNILFIVGEGGSGKSTLARYVADTLQSSQYRSSSIKVEPDTLEVRTPRVLSFFFSYVKPPSNAVAVLRSLLHQLFTVQPSLLRYISPDDKLRSVQQTVQAALLGGLLAQVAEYVEIFVILDALDEIDVSVREDLLDALTSPSRLPSLLNVSPLNRNEVPKSQIPSDLPHSPFKIFCTSRIGDYLELPTNLSAYTINLSEAEAADGIDHDTRLYARSKLDQCTSQKLRDNQKEVIADMLVEKAEGKILWVKLQLQTLSVLPTGSHDIFSGLAQLPSGLESLYSRELESIQRQPPHLANAAIETLEWVSFARRPLHISELKEAIHFTTDVKLPKSLPRRNLHLGNTLSSQCGSLVVIDEFDSTLWFVHQSVKEYLRGNFHLNVSRENDEVEWAHLRLARTCISYLISQDFENFEVGCAKRSKLPKQNPYESLRAPAKLTRKFPFLEYASIYWSKHLNSTSTKHKDFSASELGSLVRIVSNPRSAPFRTWFPIYWFSHCAETWERRRYPEYPTELIVLSFLGNEPEIRHLLQHTKVSVNECTQAGEEWTPLMAAAWMGNESVVDLLLRYHAGDNNKPHQNVRTLVQAIERGHIRIVQKLIAHFTRIQSSLPSQRSILDTTTEDGVTPLVASVRGGSRELVTMCLSLGADVNTPGFHPYSRSLALGVQLPKIGLAVSVSPLSAAISTGSIEISKDLLYSGADITSSDAIFVAARSSNAELLELLIDKGAEINTNYGQNAEGWNPLHCAAAFGGGKMVRRLLSHGAVAGLLDKHGRTPLQWACNTGNLEAVKTLLDKSYPSTVDITQALIYACALANFDLVNLILNAGASPSATGRDDRKSALDNLFDAGDIVQLLPCNPATSTLPHQGSRAAILRLLIRKGADLHHRDAYGDTYLQLAARRRWSKVVDALLGPSEIDINHQNSRGETAIDIAAQFGDLDLCQTFINHGAAVSPATFRNIFNSGSQPRALCPKIVEFPSPPYPTPSMRLCSMDTTPLSLTSLLPCNNHMNLNKFSSGTFKKAAAFLALRNIDNLEKIKLTTENNFPFGNKVKSWVEDHSGTPWIWWPLTPRLHPLRPGEVWLEWLCVSCLYYLPLLIPN
jgi:ankyrin repeat protein